MKNKHIISSLFFLLFCGFSAVRAQMITGTWKGKINRQKVELKLVQKGDSLTGTSYYYESVNNYRRYSVKGYFDTQTNEAVWWDDQLLEEKTPGFSISSPGKNALLSSADFNCPGDGKMMLDGKAALKEDETKQRGDVHLDKTTTASFEDEWDIVIDNYLTGGNDPDFIDSVAGIRSVPAELPNETPTVQTPTVKAEKIPTATIPPPQKTAPVIQSTIPVKIPTIEEKFTERKRVLTKEIPLSGDSIELRFYDNAEIDGDSISLFLNDKLIFEHIRLTGNAYSIKFATSELKDTNELIMVAENLGAIPPNTSYMLAIVGDKRHEAYLASTEGSSAMIRLVKRQ